LLAKLSQFWSFFMVQQVANVLITTLGSLLLWFVSIGRMFFKLQMCKDQGWLSIRLVSKNKPIFVHL
jgi:hypothetical protein